MAALARSRRHDDFADDFAVLDQPQAFGGLFEREHLVDHRLHAALRDQLHQALEIVVVEAVGADDLELETPDVAQVFLRIVTGGGATDKDLATALD